MRTCNKYVLILLLVFSWSCGNGDKNDMTYIDLSGTIENISPTILYSSDDKYLTAIDIVDSFMVILQHSVDTTMLVLNINSKQIVKGLGQIGQGPEDVIDPEFIQNMDKDSAGCIYFEDLNTRKLLQVDLRKDNANFSLKKLIEYPDIIFPSSELCFSSRYMAGRKVETQGKMFYIFDIEKDLLNEIDFFPVVDELKSNQNYFFAPHLLMNSRKNIVVAGMYFFDMVQLYDLDGNRKKVIAFSKKPVPNVESKGQSLDIRNGFAGIKAMYATENYCYLLREQQIPINSADNSGNEPEFDTETAFIQLDWDGNLIHSYSIKDEIGQFCVDEKSKKIYAIQHKVDDMAEFYNVVFYDIE
jgi:hypothetical protein